MHDEFIETEKETPKLTLEFQMSANIEAIFELE